MADIAEEKRYSRPLRFNGTEWVPLSAAEQQALLAFMEHYNEVIHPGIEGLLAAIHEQSEAVQSLLDEVEKNKPRRRWWHRKESK